MVFFPGFQFAGQTTPFSSVYLKAYISLTTSFTFLPTGASFT